MLPLAGVPLFIGRRRSSSRASSVRRPPFPYYPPKQIRRPAPPTRGTHSVRVKKVRKPSRPHANRIPQRPVRGKAVGGGGGSYRPRGYGKTRPHRSKGTKVVKQQQQQQQQQQVQQQQQPKRPLHQQKGKRQKKRPGQKQNKPHRHRPQQRPTTTIKPPVEQQLYDEYEVTQN
jgi:hypothetical protein